MRVHPLALSALLVVTSTDAFVGKVPRSKPSVYENGALKRLQSVVAEASPATTRLWMFDSNEDYRDYEQYQNYQEYEDYQNYEGVSLDATQTNNQWTYSGEEVTGNSLTLAEADASTVESTATETPKPATPPPATAGAAGGAFSALAETPVLGAGAVAFGGLAVARTALGQRQKKLDEEKRNLEEQQKRLETESAKLQKDTSQSNIFLSTIGSVAIGTALTTGGVVEEFTQSTMQSLEGIGGGMNLENGIKESMKGGGFKTTAGTVVERPALGQQELPYLESKIEQEATKQQTKQRAAKFLNNRRQKLTVKQNELESMTAKREASIAAEEERLQAIADEEARLKAEEEALQRQLLAERNEAARLQREAEEAEAARVKAAEEEKLRKEAEEARIRQEEEARIQKEAEKARIRQEEDARIQKEAEEARIRQEEEARIQKEAEEAERLRIEEQSKEQARQEAIAREQRALEILRQQEEELALQEQRPTPSTATAAGINTLRGYASKFSSEYYANQLQMSPTVDTEKLQLLLGQLGISPGIVGGAAALLVVGSGATAIKNLIDEAEENDGAFTSGDAKPVREEDTLSSQVEKLLEKKRQENTQQPSTVKKTLRISDGSQNEIAGQKSQTTSAPPSIKFGGNPPQPKVTPPSVNSNTAGQQAPLSSSPDSSRFGTPTGVKKNGTTSSTSISNPFENKFSQSSSSGATNFGGTPPAKKSYSVSSPKQNAFSSPDNLPGVGGVPSKNPSPTKAFGPPKSFGSPPKFSPGKQTNSPFAKSSPGKEPASPFDSSVPKAESDFWVTPPKSIKSPDKQTSSTFGTVSKQSPPSKQAAFSASVPSSTGSPSKKSIPPFNPSGKKAPFNASKASLFDNAPSKTGSPTAFGSPEQTAPVLPNNFELSPKKTGRSPFKQGNIPVDNGLKQSSPKVQTTPSFGASPPKGPSSSFGSPKSFASPPKKFVGPPGKEINSPFGMAPKQAPPGKDLASSPFGSPPTSAVQQPGKKTDSPFGSSPKLDTASKKTPSPFAAYGTPQKQGSGNKDQKKPFSPFSQRDVSEVKPKPSFSSSGPVYMPPASKANNAASLKDVYSSLEKKQKNGSQEKGKQDINGQSSVATSGPKKSFSPFGGTRSVSKSAFSYTQLSSTSPNPPNAQDVSANRSNDSNASLEISPPAEEATKKAFSSYGSQAFVSPQGNLAPPTSAAPPYQNQGVKKSYSPYGRKPQKRAENFPKVDPSSFSFGAPPSGDPNDTVKSSSFSSTMKPFAATGFAPTGEEPDNARNEVMETIRDEQQKQ